MENKGKKQLCGRKCKQVSREKFQDVWDLYGTRQITKQDAAKILGVSDKTFTKWRDMIILNNGIDDSWEFFKGNTPNIYREGYDRNEDELSKMMIECGYRWMKGTW